MSIHGKSRPELSKCAIDHPYERRAVVLLARAGWTYGELAMCFNVGEDAIRRVIKSAEVDLNEH